MPQRQFRSDDTSYWAERYGRRLDGAVTISSDTVLTPASALCTGSSGGTALTGTFSGFTVNRAVAVIQIQGTGVTDAINWELNVISSITSTLNMKYPLTRNYNTGAIVVEFLEPSSLTVNSGVNYRPAEWDGDKHGILPILCNGITTLNGWLDLKGRGWIGGDGQKASFGNHAYQGESYSGLGGTVGSGKLNANGGGGGNDATYGSGSGSGSGGSYGTAGGGAKAGATYGDAALKNVLLGSGGGGGFENGGGAAGENGGDGAGLLILITRELIINASTGFIMLNGDNGQNSATYGGGGGSGGGGLIKCQKATGLNRVSATGGTEGTTQLNGGAGGKGRLHVDYAYSIAGHASADPVFDTRQDALLAESGALFGNY